VGRRGFGLGDGVRGDASWKAGSSVFTFCDKLETLANCGCVQLEVISRIGIASHTGFCSDFACIHACSMY
jgi:hypothetical protein